MTLGLVIPALVEAMSVSETHRQRQKSRNETRDISRCDGEDYWFLSSHIVHVYRCRVRIHTVHSIYT